MNENNSLKEEINCLKDENKCLKTDFSRKEFNLKINCLETDLIKYKILSKSYEKLIDKIKTIIDFNSFDKALGFNELFNEIKSFNDCNESEAIVSIQEIQSKTEVIDNESEDNNSETDIDFNENLDQMSDDFEEESDERCVCKTRGKHFSSKS